MPLRRALGGAGASQNSLLLMMEPLITNRFPIFAAWCYVIARRLGYTEEEARSLAITRAKLGAAARAGTLGTRPQPAGHAGRTPDEGEVRKVEQVEFVGMRPYVTKVGGKVRGVLRSGGARQVVTPRQYETSVERRLGDAYPRVLRLLETLAATLPPEDLNERGYAFWERFAPMVRDESGHEAKPRFGQRAVFDPAKVERLAAEVR